MKTICLNINIHKTVLLKKYRFFDIGNDNFYFDDDKTRVEIENNIKNYIQPMLKIFLSLSEKYGKKFRCSLTISGTMLKMLDIVSKECLEMIKQLVDIDCVELVGMPYNHSLSAVGDTEEFLSQVRKHSDALYDLFAVRPTSFRNTELIYSDEIGELVYSLGYSSVLIEGNGKSLDMYGSDTLYYNPRCPRQKLIPRNEDLSRMMQDSLKDNRLFTPKYFAQKLLDQDSEGNVVYIGINSDNLDSSKIKDRDLIAFMSTVLETILNEEYLCMDTPTNISLTNQPVAPFVASNPFSGMNRYHDLTPWLGNELQQEAFQKVTSFKKVVKLAKDEVLTEIWENLQSSDYFYYMSTEFFNNPSYGYKPNPYKSPYEAFINYMNIISDLERRLQEKIKEKQEETLSDEEIRGIIKHYETVILELKQKLDHSDE